jgi:hypothetical protein
MATVRVATYERMVRASLARVRENVLDWEHLPWLHRDTFGHVRLLARRPDGWRAEVSLRGAPEGDVFVLDVGFEPDGLRYHSRTVTGRGAGTDIVTSLEPVGPRETRIVVEFLVPDIPPAGAERVGAAYERLYTRLWDEDETMMRRRQDVLDGRARPAWREVSVAGRLVRHATVCPHMGGPLDDSSFVDGCVTCPWHGYTFDLRTGTCVQVPSLRLPVGTAS